MSANCGSRGFDPLKNTFCVLIFSVKNSVFPTLPDIHNQPWAELPCLTKGYVKERAILPIKVTKVHNTMQARSQK